MQKYKHSSLHLSILIGFFVTVFSALSNIDIPYFPPLIASISLDILTGLLTGIATYVFFEYNRFSDEEWPGQVDKFLQIMDKRLADLLVSLPFGTKAGNFEGILNALRRKPYNIRWLTVKLISAKLNADFNLPSEFCFPMNSTKDFAELLEDIVDESTDSIYWTCPYLPNSWFDEIKAASQHKMQLKIKTKSKLLLEDYPRYLQKFITAKVPIKQRIVNLSEAEYNILTTSIDSIDSNTITDEDKYKLTQFLAYSAYDPKIETKFINVATILAYIGKESSKYANADYGVYDRSVLVWWNREDKKCRVSLKAEVDAEAMILFNAESTLFINAKDIQSKLNKLVNNIAASGDINSTENNEGGKI